MRPLMIAHRGDGKNFPENTIEAFESALKKGADGIECDVHLDDGKLVVVHDYLHEKQKKYPLLGEVLKKFAKKCFIEIEVKSFDKDIVRDIAKQIDIHKLEQYELTSSELPLLQYVRKSFPRSDIGMIFKSFFIEDWMTEELTIRKVLGYLRLTGANVAHIEPQNLTKDLVDEVHDQGYRVHSHLFDDDIKEYEKLSKLGVDKFTFDDVALLEHL